MIYKNRHKFEKYDVNISFDEVFNTMVINFQRAINTFDASKGNRFITHLTAWLNEIVKNPKHFMEKLGLTHRIKSIDDKISGKKGDDKDRSIEDFMADPEDFIQTNERDGLIKDVIKVINTFKDRDALIIKLKLGLIDNKYSDKFIGKKGKITNNSIAKVLGMSAVGVRKSYLTGLKKIRTKLG